MVCLIRICEQVLNIERVLKEEQVLKGRLRNCELVLSGVHSEYQTAPIIEHDVCQPEQSEGPFSPNVMLSDDNVRLLFFHFKRQEGRGSNPQNPLVIWVTIRFYIRICAYDRRRSDSGI